MAKVFNVNGACKADRHYMVNLTPRLNAIKRMIDAGEYFSINRARQYGKTTTLRALADYLKKEYVVISLDFQRMSSSDFHSESSFTSGLSREISNKIRRRNDVPDEIKRSIEHFADDTVPNMKMAKLFDCFSQWCEVSSRPVVLIIDEVDTASNNQVFLDFLAQLRAAYIDSDETPTFQSVILSGVYDIRNIKRKIRSDEEHKMNSPWNIAADFEVDMSFSAEDIGGMLEQYEADCHTGMNVREMSTLLYDYTSGYPFLVSRLCKLIDETIIGIADIGDKKAAWTKNGFLEALKILLNETNPLYQSLKGKLEDYPELKTVLYDLLFTGKPVPYTAMNDYIGVASMFGFIKNINGMTVISNRIFETVLYNWFMSEEYVNSKLYAAGLQGKNQFVVDGHLNVRRILEKFVESFDYLYGDQDDTFLEDAGRRYFMLFLKPIINGTGNCYVESETRNHERMDLVIDYYGEQFIIEMKVWRGDAYNKRGEKQLADYLDYYGLKKGYMLSFNFNKKKEIGVKDIVLGDRLLVEAVV